MGANDYRRCVAGGHRGWGISAASGPLFAAPPCTVGTQGWLPDLVSGCTPLAAACVLIIGGIGGLYVVCFPGEIFVYHGRSGPVERELLMVRRMTVFAAANEMGRGGVPAIMLTYGHWLAKQC